MSCSRVRLLCLHSLGTEQGLSSNQTLSPSTEALKLDVMPEALNTVNGQ